MQRLEELLDQDIQFTGISHVVELFPAPIPEQIPTDDEHYAVDEASELFRMSHWFGTTELYLPAGTTLTATTSNGESTVSAEDFLKFQLKYVTTETLYYLVSKTDTASEVAEILDFDAEYDKDDEYDPEGWLNEYNSDSFDQGIAYLDRLKEESADDLLSIIAEGCLDENYGLLRWPDENISDNWFAKNKYDEWDVRVAIVFEGKFNPYTSAEIIENGLMLDDYVIRSVIVRNYDEG